MKFDLSAMLADLRKVDPNNPGAWPASVRNLALAVLLLILGGLGYWFQIQPQLTALKAAQAKEPELRQSFESKQRQVANLDAYKGQLRDIQTTSRSCCASCPARPKWPISSRTSPRRVLPPAWKNRCSSPSQSTPKSSTPKRRFASA